MGREHDPYRALLEHLNRLCIGGRRRNPCHRRRAITQTTRTCAAEDEHDRALCWFLVRAYFGWEAKWDCLGSQAAPAVMSFAKVAECVN